MKIKFLLCFIMILYKSYAQTTSQVEEKRASLTCQEILDLKNYAVKKFEGLKGDRDTSDTSSSGIEYYFSKTSYGIAGSTRIGFGYAVGSIAIEFTLYFGIDGKKAQENYLLAVNELNKCVTHLGFEKETKKFPNQNPLIDVNKEATTYFNYRLHTYYTVTLMNPLVSEIDSAHKPTKYIPSEMVVINVTRLPDITPETR